MFFQYPKNKIKLTTGYIKNSNKHEIFHSADTEFVLLDHLLLFVLIIIKLLEFIEAII